MDDQTIVALYFDRSQQAIAETREKYGRYCHYIASHILGNDADAEEVVADAWLKTWNTIPPHRPASLKAYVGMLTRQLALDAWDAQNAQKRGGQLTLALEELAQCIPDWASKADMAEGMALKTALNQFLRRLPQRTRQIFVRRYWYASSVVEIARDFGMKESAVTVLMLRTRRKLKAHLEKEGFSV